MVELPKKGTLKWELIQAHTHAAKVLEHVYNDKPPRPIRGWLWRQQMLRAESILMKLMVRELAKLDEDDDLPQPVIPDPGTTYR